MPDDLTRLHVQAAAIDRCYRPPLRPKKKRGATTRLGQSRGESLTRCAKMSRTRRLAAVLAADVAGYSRLIGTDQGAIEAARGDLCGADSPKSPSTIPGSREVLAGGVDRIRSIARNLPESGAAEASTLPRHRRPDYPFFAGFFFAGVATERTVLTLPAPALPASFFDMAIGFTSA